MIVVDASALIDAIDGQPGILERLVDEDIHAPHLINIEVASALRRLVATDRLDQQHAIVALRVLEQAEIYRHPHQPLLPIIWSLRDRVSAHDAAYVALAAALEVPLVTTDRELASIAGLPCAVEVP